MHVSEIMTCELVTVTPDDSVEEAVRLLQRRGIRHLLVVQQGKLVGIISDRDIKRTLDPRKTRKKIMGVGGLYFLLEPLLVREIMTRDPVTITPQTEIRQAAWIMVQRRFGALPVVENGSLVGILTETDVLSYFAEFDQAEAELPTAAQQPAKKTPARRARPTKPTAKAKGGRNAPPRKGG
jgi:acetoin utilization protein AcuB